MASAYPVTTAIAAIALAALASCAGPAPALKQAEERSGPMTFVKPFESGTVAGNVYTPSAAERELDCKRLKGSMIVIAARLKEAASRPRASGASSALQSGVSSIKGQPNTLDLDAELVRERARLTAYNTLLVEKKCPPMDLAKELAPAR